MTGILLATMAAVVILGGIIVVGHIREIEQASLARQAQLRHVLRELVDAGEALEADQSGATDSRCGEVQPITVEEGKAFSDALRRARKVLAFQAAEP
jgi:hypothetical protein